MAQQAQSTGLRELLSRRWPQILLAALVGAVVGFVLAYRRPIAAIEAEGPEEGPQDTPAPVEPTDEESVTEKLDGIGRRLLLLGVDALEAHVKQHFASLRLQAEEGPATEASQETTDS